VKGWIKLYPTCSKTLEYGGRLKRRRGKARKNQEEKK
jgi:hypothetical protein